MNRLSIFLIGLFVAVAMFMGCNKERLECNEFCSECDQFCLECDEICLYSNVEDFYKTAPLINAYLRHLSKNDWDVEMKVQALTECLNSKSCIINAEIVSVEEVPDYSDWYGLTVPWPPPSVGSIAILLDDKGITRELTLYIRRDLFSPDLLIAGRYEYMISKEIGVFTHSHITIDKVFDFINLFEHNVEFITNDRFISAMQPHYQSNIVSALHEKPYIQSFHTGVESSTNEIFMFLWLYNMDNRDYQADWLKTMNDFELFEGGSHPYYFIKFLVLEGKEREWQAKFETYNELVSRTRLHYDTRSMLIQ